jgi:hypothetical protein
LVLDLIAVIATVIAGVLFRWASIAIFRTKGGFVVSAAAASALPVYLSALVDSL